MKIVAVLLICLLALSECQHAYRAYESSHVKRMLADATRDPKQVGTTSRTSKYYLNRLKIFDLFQYRSSLFKRYQFFLLYY